MKHNKKSGPVLSLTVRRVRTGVSVGMADHNEITSDKFPTRVAMPAPAPAPLPAPIVGWGQVFVGG